MCWATRLGNATIRQPVDNNVLVRIGEAPEIGWSRNMLYSGFNILPRSVVRRQTGFAARITRTLSGLRMRKRQFAIRTLLIATMLVAVSFPTAMSHYDDVKAFLFPPQRPTAAEIIPNLLRRVPPSSAKEIMIRPLGNSKFEVTIPD